MDPSVPKKPKNRFRVFAITVLILLFAVWGIFKASIFGQAPSELEDALRAAKAEGLPMNAYDVAKIASVPEDKNAAPELKKAIADLKSFDETPEGKQLEKLIHSSKFGYVSLKPEQYDAARPAIMKMSPVFNQLVLAVQKPYLSFDRQWSTMPMLTFPEFASEREAVRLEILKARLDLASGNTTAALGSFDVASKLSSLAGQEPVLISILVQTAMRDQICEGLADVIKSHSGELGVTAKCRQILTDLGPRPNLLPAIRSEFVFGRMALRLMGTPAGAGAEDSQEDTATRLARIGPVRTIYDLRYTELYTKLCKDLNAKQGSYVQMRLDYENVEKTIESRAGGDWTYGYLKDMFPVFSQAPAAVAEGEARKNVLLCALDLLETKRDKGQFPATLPSGTGHWQDPCSDRPLLYHRTDKGFLIYSVGRSGRDFGGVPRSENHDDEDYNIPFSFP